jgi:hypothetical protein
MKSAGVMTTPEGSGGTKQAGLGYRLFPFSSKKFGAGGLASGGRSGESGAKPLVK